MSGPEASTIVYFKQQVYNTRTREKFFRCLLHSFLSWKERKEDKEWLSSVGTTLHILSSTAADTRYFTVQVSHRMRLLISDVS